MLTPEQISQIRQAVDGGAEIDVDSFSEDDLNTLKSIMAWHNAGKTEPRPEPENYVIPQGQSRPQEKPSMVRGIAGDVLRAIPGPGAAALGQIVDPNTKKLYAPNQPGAEQELTSPRGQHLVRPPGGLGGMATAFSMGATPFGLARPAINAVSGGEGVKEAEGAVNENPGSFAAGQILNPLNRIGGTAVKSVAGGALGGMGGEIAAHGLSSPLDIAQAGVTGGILGRVAHGGQRAAGQITRGEVENAANQLGDKARWQRTNDVIQFLGLKPEEAQDLMSDPERLKVIQSQIADIMPGNESGMGRLPGLGAVPSDIKMPAHDAAQAAQANAADVRRQTYPRLISSDAMRASMEADTSTVPGNQYSTPESQLNGAPRGRINEHLLSPKGEFLPEPAPVPPVFKTSGPMGPNFYEQPQKSVNRLVPSERVGQRIGDIASGAYASGPETGFRPYEPANAFSINSLNNGLAQEALKAGVPYDQVRTAVDVTRNAAETSRVASQLGIAAENEPPPEVPVLARLNTTNVGGVTIKPGAFGRVRLRRQGYRIGSDPEVTSQAIQVLRDHAKNVGGDFYKLPENINPFDAQQMANVLEQIQALPPGDRAAYMYVATSGNHRFIDFQKWLDSFNDSSSD